MGLKSRVDQLQHGERVALPADVLRLKILSPEQFNRQNADVFDVVDSVEEVLKREVNPLETKSHIFLDSLDLAVVLVLVKLGQVDDGIRRLRPADGD